MVPELLKRCRYMLDVMLCLDYVVILLMLPNMMLTLSDCFGQNLAINKFLQSWALYNWERKTRSRISNSFKPKKSISEDLSKSLKKWILLRIHDDLIELSGKWLPSSFLSCFPQHQRHLKSNFFREFVLVESHPCCRWEDGFIFIKFFFILVIVYFEVHNLDRKYRYEIYRGSNSQNSQTFRAGLEIWLHLHPQRQWTCAKRLCICHLW